MPKPYPKEYRDDVVAVAREGEAPLHEIAQDFGISERLTDLERAELREAKKRIRLLEQENEVLRRAAAYYKWLKDPSANGTGTTRTSSMSSSRSTRKTRRSGIGS